MTSRGPYPWGRRHPKLRLAELDAKMAALRLERRVLEDRLRERLLDYDRAEAALRAEAETAKACEADLIRRRTKEVAYRLAAWGIDVMDRIPEDGGGEELLKELLSLHRAESVSREEAPADFDAVPDIAEDGFVSQDLIDETLVGEGDLTPPEVQDDGWRPPPRPPPRRTANRGKAAAPEGASGEKKTKEDGPW